MVLTESNPQTTLKLLIPIFFCFSLAGFVYFFLAPALVSSLGTFSFLVSIILLKKP
ncbi:hypothetical protein LEP1GSC062_0254 [Leptospira alexanderi serovar Manhao 3 str. L 60]|uniref:Uncharacterized protein n=1 Tax=Leptospira alexanderi serovar Manhao 3 str. L 60 TaxID=1049759 RepID=V6HTM3_9LEPT|nr:hypothetical protein LEP1GSC062_0254 [Leptospira alexanderi serovar Manhao 3 str. L 60]